jgi:hypothetical protein
MIKTLMSAYEVAKCSPIMMEYPMDILCVFIVKDERGLFESCALGDKLYDAMLDDIEDVSEVNVYNEMTLYNEGDRVLYEDVVLESIIDSNAIEPCDVTAKDFWRVVEKFNNPCFQELYDRFLKFYIAFTIVGRSARFATFQASSKGTVKYSEDFRGQGSGLATVTSTEFYQWKQDILLEGDRSKSNVLEYIKEKHLAFKNDEEGGCNFSMVKDIEELCNDCDTKKEFSRKKSKFHFIR